MGGGVQPGVSGVSVVNCPTDVVMAAGIGGPGRRRRLVGKPTQGRLHETDIAGGQGAPQLHHEAVVVRHVREPAPVATFSQVSHEIIGADDRLSLEGHGRSDDPHCLAQ